MSPCHGRDAIHEHGPGCSSPGLRLGDAVTQSRSKPCCAESVRCHSPKRMEILAPLLKTYWHGALLLADRAQLARVDYIAIFKRGLAEADASSIKFWLEATVGRIGWRKVISILHDVTAPWPSRGACALYHVPSLFGDYPLPPSLK